MKIGQKIKMIRLLKGINPKAICQEINMSLAGYYKIERSEVDISFEKLEKISIILKVSVVEIIEFENPMMS